MVIKYKRPTHPVHPFADEKEPRPPEYETTQPSAPRALKKDGTPRKQWTRKDIVATYKRKGVAYGASPPTASKKVNATAHDRRMLDEAQRSPLHRTSSTKKRKYTLVPADYKPTTLTIPPHLARQDTPTETTEELTSQQEPQTKEQAYLESITPTKPPQADPQCYKVEFPDAMKPEQTAQEQAAHEYYLHHTAATREAARHTEAKRTEEALTVMNAPSNHLQPNDIANMRSQVFATVATQTNKIVGVLNGTEQWNPQQVRLYGMLLNKVLPDLHHSYSEVALQDSRRKQAHTKRARGHHRLLQQHHRCPRHSRRRLPPILRPPPHPNPTGPVIITQTPTNQKPKKA